ncbi:unnamed protein product [Withania somnifera]
MFNKCPISMTLMYSFVWPPSNTLHKWHVSPSKFMLCVWCLLKNRQWEPGQVQSTSGDKASVILSDGSVVPVPVGELLPANPDILLGVDDLIQLCYLNEPSVLHNLQCRYAQDRIYTKAGPVLIALNPFKEIQLYGNKLVTAYRKKILDSPHIYSIAETAYSQMMEDEINQSIIVSGVRGSGKTETEKFVIEYLVMIGGGNNQVESELLQTSCVLEAFGTAKTLKNNNSSRFGRLLEISFSAEGGICGANVQTFLLEKVKCGSTGSGERSYHIFYQLCAGAPSALRDKLNLRGTSEYNFLNQSGSLVIDNVYDAKVSYACAIRNAASLMGCSANDLTLALSTRRMQAGKDKVAIDTRDALAKFIYANLFDWIVVKINKSLAMGKEKTGRAINILDIYGFESFEKNSFEQFCINYANERLQQHFYRHLFKLEQEEYELDGIGWTRVNFQDYQECLDLFEKKPFGIISLLDEESNFHKAADLAFSDKLKQHLKAYPFCRGDGEKIVIRHYAGENILSKLMQQLESTAPHLICCIKPNNKQVAGMYYNDLVFEQLTSCGLLEVVRFSRSGYPTRMTYQEFCKRYAVLLPEDHEREDPLRMSVSVLRQFDVPPEMYQNEFPGVSISELLSWRLVAALEDVRKKVLHGTLEVQMCYSGPHARRHFDELEGVVIILQSFVRGDIARRHFKDSLESKRKVANKENDEQLVAVGQIQSAIRCWLAQRHLNQLLTMKKLNQDRQNPARMISEVKQDLPAKILPSVVEVLERRVLVAEATLEEKEKENAALKEKVNQLESRWSDYEVRMRSMEEMCQKQMASLQASLAAAKKSLGVDNSAGHPGKPEGSPYPRGYESDDTTTSMGTRAPRGSTPIEYASNGVDFGGIREINGSLCVVNYLNREFELWKQNFDDEALAIAQLKSGQVQSTSPAEDFRRLRLRFDEWKKDYKARLKETKQKTRRNWLGKKSKRLQL